MYLCTVCVHAHIHYTHTHTHTLTVAFYPAIKNEIMSFLGKQMSLGTVI